MPDSDSNVPTPPHLRDPLSRAAWDLLKQVQPAASPYSPPAVQLALWALESGEVELWAGLRAEFRAQVEEMLNWEPEAVLNVLEGPSRDQGEVILHPKNLLALGPTEAAIEVIETIHFWMMQHRIGGYGVRSGTAR